MLGNTFGRFFRVTACGESYGEALLTIVDGVPPGLKLTKEYVQAELDKRRPGQSTSHKRHKDLGMERNTPHSLEEGFPLRRRITLPAGRFCCHRFHPL